MNNDPKLLITEKGKKNISSQIKDLEMRLIRIRSRKGEASENGGNAWHDNAEFEDLEHQERMLMGEVSELKLKLNKADDIADVSRIHSELEVGVGSIIIISYVESGEKVKIEIVGYGESDPDAGKIAYDSPLAKCINGARVGEKRELELHDCKRTIKIESIR